MKSKFKDKFKHLRVEVSTKYKKILHKDGSSSRRKGKSEGVKGGGHEVPSPPLFDNPPEIEGRIDEIEKEIPIGSQTDVHEDPIEESVPDIPLIEGPALVPEKPPTIEEPSSSLESESSETGTISEQELEPAKEEPIAAQPATEKAPSEPAESESFTEEFEPLLGELSAEEPAIEDNSDERSEEEIIRAESVVDKPLIKLPDDDLKGKQSLSKASLAEEPAPVPTKRASQEHIATFLVTDATSHQGSSAVKHLVASHVKVHALVPDFTSPAALSLSNLGATLFTGSTGHLSALTPALKGVEGMFLSPSSLAQAANLIGLASRTPLVKSIVLSSPIFTNHTSLWGALLKKSGSYRYYNDKLAIENAVKIAGFQYTTILRPGFHMQTYTLPLSISNFPELSREGEIAHCCKPDTRVPHVDAEDVGKCAARALLDPSNTHTREIELVGEWITMEHVAKTMSKVLGVEITERKRSEKEVEVLRRRVGSIRFYDLLGRWGKGEEGMGDNRAEKEFGVGMRGWHDFCFRESDKLIEGVGVHKWDDE